MLRAVIRLFAPLLFLLFFAQASRCELKLEINTSENYDTNVRSLRTNQFKYSETPDAYGDLGVKLIDVDLLYGNVFTFSYAFDYIDFRDQKDQGATKQALDLSWIWEINKNLSINPLLGFKDDEEVTQEWTNRSINPSVFISYLDDSGVLFELQYGWERMLFPDTSLKGTYQNITSYTHSIALDTKIWHNASLRTKVKYNFKNAVYDGNTSYSLYNYSGIPQNTTRNDTTHIAGIEEMLLAGSGILLNGLYEFECNISNSNRFTYSAHRFGFDIYSEFPGGHTLYLMGVRTYYNYFNDVFDTRYLNTKEDYYTDISAGYIYEFTDNIKAELKYSYIKNDSNDTVNFDPAFTKSYSSYTKQTLTLMLTFGINLI